MQRGFIVSKVCLPPMLHFVVNRQIHIHRVQMIGAQVLCCSFCGNNINTNYNNSNN